MELWILIPGCVIYSCITKDLTKEPIVTNSEMVSSLDFFVLGASSSQWQYSFLFSQYTCNYVPIFAASYMVSRHLHWLHVFPPFAVVICFPAFVTSYTISRPFVLLKFGVTIKMTSRKQFSLFVQLSFYIFLSWYFCKFVPWRTVANGLLVILLQLICLNAWRAKKNSKLRKCSVATSSKKRQRRKWEKFLIPATQAHFRRQAKGRHRRKWTVKEIQMWKWNKTTKEAWCVDIQSIANSPSLNGNLIFVH